VIQRTQELRLDSVEETPARQRIHPDKRLGLIPRFETMDGGKQELIGTNRKALERRQRIRATAETLPRDRSGQGWSHLDQAIAPRPCRPAARPATDHRAAQRFVEPEQIVRVTLYGRRIARIEERSQDRKIVLEIVDRTVGILRRRPCQARPGFVGGVGRQHAVIRHLTGDRPHHVKRIERGHACTRFGHVHARIGQIQTFRRRANRNLQQQTLCRAAIILHEEIAIGLAPPIVEEQRIFAGALRHNALGQTRHEDDPERSPARLMRRADEEPPISTRWRVPIECRQAIVQHVPRFLERHRTDRGHRTQIGERPEHTIGARERARCD
jgi:hypothetical protein